MLALLALPVLAFYAVNFRLGTATGVLLDFSYDEVACFNRTIRSQNSPTALVIAIVVFPIVPLIALTPVIGPFPELPLLSVAATLLRRLERSGWDGGDRIHA